MNKTEDSKGTKLHKERDNVTKRIMYNWASPGPMGEFMMISKNLLNIDGNYQREATSRERVMAIARDFDWKLFGVLSVVRRKDGSYWVTNGGHRSRALFKRDDITEVPCLVFQVEDEKEEAKAFVGQNFCVGLLSAYHLHRASVRAGEPFAMAVQEELDRNGLVPVSGSKRSNEFSAIHCLRSLIMLDKELAKKVLSACVEIANGKDPISGVVLSSVFACERKLAKGSSILTKENLEKLIYEGIKGIEIAIRRERNLSGKGGEAMSAKAVLDIVNRKRRNRLTFA